MKNKSIQMQILKDIKEYSNILESNEEKDIKNHVYYIIRQLEKEICVVIKNE